MWWRGSNRCSRSLPVAERPELTVNRCWPRAPSQSDCELDTLRLSWRSHLIDRSSGTICSAADPHPDGRRVGKYSGARPGPMHIDRLRLQRFRSCADVTVCFHHELTVLVGENNSGKSNIIDGLRLLTLPLNGRRERYPEDATIWPARRHASSVFHRRPLCRSSDTIKGLLDFRPCPTPPRTWQCSARAISPAHPERRVAASPIGRGDRYDRARERID